MEIFTLARWIHWGGGGDLYLSKVDPLWRNVEVVLQECLPLFVGVCVVKPHMSSQYRSHLMFASGGTESGR